MTVTRILPQNERLPRDNSGEMALLVIYKVWSGAILLLRVGVWAVFRVGGNCESITCQPLSAAGL